MTDLITYEHSAASGTIALPTNNIQIKRVFIGKGTDAHDDGVIKAYDSNRYQRIITFTTLLSGANYNTLDALMAPGAGNEPDYTTAYPRFTELYYSNTLKYINLEVICVEMDSKMSGRLDGDQAWAVTLRFEEKTD